MGGEKSVQLDLLWNYMQYDMEADKFESDMRHAENRVKLMKQRDFLLEQQNNIKKIEAEVTAMVDRLEAIKDESERLSGLLKTQIDSIDLSGEDIGAIGGQIDSVRKLEEALKRYEQELAKMKKDSETRDRQQKEIRVRAARTKAEFDKLKQEYEVEFKGDSEKLSQLKAKAAQESKAIDPALVERYNKIKQHIAPPMAKLNGDRCGGCNMSLPAATLSQISDSSKVIDCDNCGRILYIPSGK